MTKIFTSSWKEYKGVGRIGICQGNPRGIPAGYRMYKPLAPSWDIIKTSANQTDYRVRYFGEVLNNLDPHKVIDDVLRLANGNTPVLTCFETNPLTFENFCHRTMVAEWLNKHTGADVREWSGLAESNGEGVTGSLL